jgi:uncharacterized protein YlzI (FlbEa/FlbD family)
VVEYWKENPDVIVEKLMAGQAYVKEKYTDEVILNGWLETFKDLGLIKEIKN